MNRLCLTGAILTRPHGLFQSTSASTTCYTFSPHTTSGLEAMLEVDWTAFWGGLDQHVTVHAESWMGGTIAIWQEEKEGGPVFPAGTMQQVTVRPTQRETVLHINALTPHVGDRNYTLTLNCQTCETQLLPTDDGESVDDEWKYRERNQEKDGPPGSGTSGAGGLPIWGFLVIFGSLVTFMAACCGFQHRMIHLRQQRARRARVLHGVAPDSEVALTALEPRMDVVGASELKADESCSICLAALGERRAEEKALADSTVLRLPCGHRFHGGCIRMWIVQKGLDASCPLCNRPVAADRDATSSTSAAPLPPPSPPSPNRVAPVLPDGAGPSGVAGDDASMAVESLSDQEMDPGLVLAV